MRHRGPPRRHGDAGVSVGRRARPIDWRDRTSGRAAYAADLVRPGDLHGVILRSPHPHARIVQLDVSPAEAMPGVAAVVTAGDFPPGMRYLHQGGPLSERPPLADGVVRFVGQEVAAVAARTREQAEAACRAIRVRYTPLAAPFTIREALRPGAPTLHDRAGQPNVAARWCGEWGEPNGATGHAAHATYSYPSVSHACMESNTTLAQWHEDAGILELWTSTQSPYFVIQELAHLLGISEERIICREVAIGGGFGAKSKISEHEVLAAALARKARSRVLIALTREEEFTAAKPRHRFETTLRTVVNGHGLIRLVDASILVDNGAYSHMGMLVMRTGVDTLGSVYTAGGVRFDARLVDTATQPGGQFRGYGEPQVAFALESQLDELASELGVDPIELRLRNLVRPYSVTPCGHRLTSSRLAECLAAVRVALDWDAKRGHRRRPGRGVGVAAGMHASGTYLRAGANRCDAAIDVLDTGRVRVRVGVADAGTGQRTILAQIAAHELGVSLADVEVLSMDTERTPFDMGAWSSRGTHMSGMAVRKAAREVAALLRERPAGHCGGLSHQTTYLHNTAPQPPTYAFAAHGAEVEVDRRTGQVRLVDYVAAHDAGRPINPTLVEGQIAGGAAMGIGAALGEELVREGGRVVNDGFGSYALPRAADLPPIRSIIVDSYDPAGPYGAKCVGELPITPPAAAIASAVYDAIGVRIRELPITPDKVLRALAEKDRRVRSFRLWRRPDRWWVAAMRWLYPRGLFRLLVRIGPRSTTAQPQRGPDRLDTPRAIAEAAGLLEAGGVAIAGGTDLLPRRRQGLVPPGPRWVSLTDVDELRRLHRPSGGGISIGGGVTLAELATAIGDSAPAIAAAVRTIASPQIRNVGTVAGNLLQANRCWFLRSGLPCYQRCGGAAPCYAVLGDHRFHHAAMGAHRCQAVTPSDLATVLIAHDAHAVLAGAGRRRTVPLDRFYTGPAQTRMRAGEVLAEIHIPGRMLGRGCCFEKLALRSGDFAMAAVALSAQGDTAGRWRDVRLVVGGIAPTPWRARRVERALEGTTPTPARVRALLDAELGRTGDPLPGNVWKLDAAAGLTETAAERLAAAMRLPQVLPDDEVAVGC